MPPKILPIHLNRGRVVVMPRQQNTNEPMGNSEQKPLSALVKPARSLRHFGLDYLTLNLGTPHGQPVPKSIAFLNALFSLPYNLTNASEFNDVTWGVSSEEVNLHFSACGKDHAVYVYRGENKIMVIRKIGLKSNMPPAVKARYQYQVQFYGSFFSLVRVKCFTLQDYWSPFLQDIQDDTINSSVSRMDICTDIENVNVRSIQRSIRGKGKMKPCSELEIDDKTGIPETVYYGRHSQDWKARIYNKTKEISAKHKETLYPDYIDSPCITRLEVELHSKPCQEYLITLPKCQDLEFILGIYEKLLSNKAAHWGILRFIKSELKKVGYKAIPAQRTKIAYNKLSNNAYFKRAVTHVKEFARRTGLTTEEVMREMEHHL